MGVQQFCDHKHLEVHNLIYMTFCSVGNHIHINTGTCVSCLFIKWLSIPFQSMQIYSLAGLNSHICNWSCM